MNEKQLKELLEELWKTEVDNEAMEANSSKTMVEKIRFKRLNTALSAFYAHAATEAVRQMAGPYSDVMEGKWRARVEGLRWALEMFRSVESIDKLVEKSLKH